MIRRVIPLTLGLVLAVTALGACGTGTNSSSDLGKPQPQSTLNSPDESATSQSTTTDAPRQATPADTRSEWADVVATARESIVRIEANLCDGGSAVGSGFVIGDRILTNNHVIANASQITVVTAGGSRYPITAIRVSDSDDLAVMSAPTGLPTLRWATAAPRIADEVATLGFPRGIGFSFSKGSVSALDVTLSDDAGTVNGLIQTDAAINPGNSGGPLILRDGSVVGVVVLKITDGEGLAFAIDGRRAQVFLSGESGTNVSFCPSTATVSVEETTPPTADPAESPQASGKATTPAGQVVLDFYNALNLRDYESAWRLGGSNLGSDPTFSKFAEGYAQTRSVHADIQSDDGTNVVVIIEAEEEVDGGLRRSYYRNSYVIDRVIVSGTAELISREAAGQPKGGAGSPASWNDCWLVQVASTNNVKTDNEWVVLPLEVFEMEQLYVVSSNEWPEKLQGETVLLVLAAPTKEDAEILLDQAQAKADPGSLMRHPPITVCSKMVSLADLGTK